mgnify:CR=1 FL=1
MKQFLSHIKTCHLFMLGLLILLFSLIPGFILGADTIIPYHDQLDGEIIAYIYQAKYLFSGQNIIPEFLNGASKTTLTPPAPLAVLLFYFFSPLTAYTILQITAQTFAYIGMFLFINKLTANKYVSFLVAILYTFIPFLPVYGLSQYGIPMLLFCFWNLYEHKYSLPSYLYIALYTGMSSLVLCGFAWLSIGFVLTIIFLLAKKFRSQLKLLLSFCLMLIIYTLENLPLIRQLLTPDTAFVSHKEEYTLNSISFFPQFLSYFKDSGEHAPDYHQWIVPLVLGTFLCILFTFKQLTPTARNY